MIDLGIPYLRGGFASSGAPSFTFILDFTSSEVLDSRVTATGGTNGTRINSAGLIETKAAPRYDYDPTTFALRGVRIEEARSNLFTGALIGGGGLITQSVTVTAAPTTISFSGPGSNDLSGAFTGTIIGTGPYPQRVTLTFTPTAGALVCTVTGQVQFAQCETGAFATSFIPTAGAPVSRVKDVLLITGANFSSWFNQSAGTFLAKADLQASNNNILFEIDDGGATNRFYSSISGVNLNFVASVASVNQAVFPLGAVVIGATTTLAAAYALNDFAASRDGAAVLTDTAGTLPTVTQLALGHALTNSQMNGHLQRFAYNPVRMSNADLVALSGGSLKFFGFDPAIDAGPVMIEDRASHG